MNAPFSIWSQYYGTKDPEDAILEFKKDGITHIELSFEHSAALLERGDDHIAIGRKFAEFLREHGISVSQGHLYFPTHFCTDENYFKGLVREIEMFWAIGIKNAVLHCDFMKDVDISYDDRRELNIKKLRELFGLIEHVDITICLENLSKHVMGADELVEIIEKVGSEKLAICLDTGHLNISKADTQYDFIKKAGKHLKALHLHDNEGKTDQHILPFGRGKINFDEIVKALCEIDYDGLFNFEIPGENSCPIEILHQKAKYTKEIYDYLMDLEN